MGVKRLRPLLNVATNSSAAAAVAGANLPAATAISPDGNRAYIPEADAPGMEIFNIVTNQFAPPLRSTASPAREWPWC